MGALTDTDIRKRLASDQGARRTQDLLILPFDEESLTPIGYDLRVGEWYATSDNPLRRQLKRGETLTIRPHSTALIESLESVDMPQDRSLMGLIESKVSRVSRGLSHISTTVDPDWEGHLLIAVHNHSERRQVFKSGDQFCTLVFIRTESPSTKRCGKGPGRKDLLYKMLEESARKRALSGRMANFAPPAIVIVTATVGYVVFGSTAGMAACATGGAALALYVSSRLR